jgi:hypothetical protein
MPPVHLSFAIGHTPHVKDGAPFSLGMRRARSGPGMPGPYADVWNEQITFGRPMYSIG